MSCGSPSHILQVRTCCAFDVHSILLTICVVAPLFWFTSIELGGYGFTPQMISVFMSFGGAAQAAWLLLAFPYLQRRFGTVKVLKGCAIIWPIFFALPPVCNTLLRYNLRPAFWVLSILLQVFGSSVAMAFSTLSHCPILFCVWNLSNSV